MSQTKDPTPSTGSPSETNSTSSTKKYRLVELWVDPIWDKLSHTRFINILGAITASGMMVWLMIIEKMSEGYFGIYLAAVGLTAVGMKAVETRTNAPTSNPPAPPQ